MKRYITLIITILLSLHACGGNHNNSSGTIITEASGIARIDDRLIIVGDDSDGRYFEFPLEKGCSPVIPIDPEKVKEILLPGAELAMDLEGIDVLADGRIVVLSEQLRCLISKRDKGDKRPLVVAEYDKTLTEFGHKGLEGLAVKRLAGGDSKVAVLWEGGYPQFAEVPPQLRGGTCGLPLKPVIVVHEIKRDAYAGRVENPLLRIELDAPEPPGEPPNAQRFRATDLVWFTSENGEEEFIVLLNSENAPLDDEVEYKFKILQRFDMNGDRVGAPLNINDICRNIMTNLNEDDLEKMSHASVKHLEEIQVLLEAGTWENVNWEGLGWFVEGQSLVIIYDAVPKDPPFAFVIDIPEQWR